jgi:hypothetical protein
MVSIGMTTLFSIDGNLQDLQCDDAPEYNWIIYYYDYFLIGRRTLEVYVTTPSGKVVSDEMNIIVYNI